MVEVVDVVEEADVAEVAKEVDAVEEVDVADVAEVAEVIVVVVVVGACRLGRRDGSCSAVVTRVDWRRSAWCRQMRVSSIFEDSWYR